MDRFIFLLYVNVFVIFSFAGCDISNKKDSEVHIVDEFSTKKSKGYIYYNGELFNGIVESRYGNGNLRKKYKVSNGIEKEMTRYFINGDIAESRVFTSDSTCTLYKMNDKGKVVYESEYLFGNIQSEKITDSISYKYLYDKNGKVKNGLVTGVFSNGDLAFRRQFNNGLQEGISVWYHTNQRVKTISTFRHDKLDGKVVEYHENGKLKSEQTFREGKIDGKVVGYHENGKLKSEQTFREGKIDGKVVKYHENGKLKSEQTFREGKIDGIFKRYGQNGELLHETYFQNDSIIKINVEPK